MFSVANALTKYSRNKGRLILKLCLHVCLNLLGQKSTAWNEDTDDSPINLPKYSIYLEFRYIKQIDSKFQVKI